MDKRQRISVFLKKGISDGEASEILGAVRSLRGVSGASCADPEENPDSEKPPLSEEDVQRIAEWTKSEIFGIDFVAQSAHAGSRLISPEKLAKQHRDMLETILFLQRKLKTPR